MKKFPRFLFVLISLFGLIQASVAQFPLFIEDDAAYYAQKSIIIPYQSIANNVTIMLDAAPTISNCPFTGYSQIYSDVNVCSATYTYNLIINGAPSPEVSYSFTGATIRNGTGTGSGSSFNVGQTTVNVNATNVYGTANCSFVITVIDKTLPVAICKPITVYLNASGKATIQPEDINNHSYDNCGLVNLSFNSGVICGTAVENQNVTLTAPFGALITNIDFASYGTPNGVCGSFTKGYCHASNSVTASGNYIIGKNSGTIPVSNQIFGDPCYGTVKRFYIQAKYGGTSSQSNEFTCSNLGSNSVTLLVTDESGNVSTCSTIVTVVDNQNPTITSPAPITVQCATAVPAANTAAVVSSDNCSSIVSFVSDVISNQTCINKYTITRTYKATDPSGNFAYCTQIITVNDNTAPVISCPSNIIVNNTAGQCGANVSFSANATDNCSGTPIITYSVASGSFFSVGTTGVTATATDICGNSSTCSFNVTVVDNQNPIIACPASILIDNTPGLCGANITIIAATAYDNCPGVTVNGHRSDNLSLSTTYPVGITTITWTATDAHQHTVSCTQTITVKDNEAPAIICAANQIQTADAGVCTALVTVLSPSTSDNCGVSSIINSFTHTSNASAVYSKGTTNITWTVTDIHGNSSTCIQTVTVNDNEAPALQAPKAITLGCGASTLPSNTGIATATDNCTTTANIVIAYTDDYSVTNCGGTITRTWSATDDANNQNTATQTITVLPAALPTMTAPAAITVACGALPMSSTILFSNGLSGNCLINGISHASTFTATPSACGGNVTETWTATDNCNRVIAAVSRIISVSPAALPTMTAPNAVTVACGALPTSSTILFSNELSGNCLINGISHASTFTATPSACGGNVTETWTATDNCNREIASVSRVITVSPAALPVMTAPAAITVACGALPMSSTILFSNGLSGNCLINGISHASTFTATPSACGGNVTETWTATDNCNREIASVSRIITVTPAALPVLTAPAAITVACGGMPMASTIAFSNGLSGNCLISGTSHASTFTANPSACGGTVTETWTATDNCNRSISAVSRIITVNPATLPVMIAPSAVTISVACGALPVPSTLSFTNGLSDGCLINGTSNPSTFVTTAGTCGGTLTEIWTATDICGRPLHAVSRTVTVSQNLGAVESFVLFSGAGAVSNTGNSNVSGDVGSNLGAVSGFGSPSTLIGGLYSATPNTTQTKIDLLNLYLHLSNIPVTNTTHAAVFGSNETITAGVYTIGGAASMAGNLNLDAQNNAHSIFILKFNGAFSPAAGSSITLLNGASAANVFWIAEGAISIGATSTMKGTFIAHTGAATMAAGGDLEGRLLSTVGAVSFGPGMAKLPADLSTIPVICVNTCNNSIVGSAGNFTLFTTAGAVSNTGSTGIIGNIGTGAGAITGFETPATTLVGTSFNADATTAQASNDLLAGYTTLVNTTATNSAHAPAFGNETLMPGVYEIAAAGSLAGTLILDGQGNPNAQFIFKFGGAFSVGAQSKVILLNGTSHCNVYWIAEGAISIGTFSFIKGTFIANNGANTMGANGNLEGSLFSTAGAIGFNTGVGYISYALCTNPASAMPVMTNTGFAKNNISISTESKLSIYPNPARGIINLVLSGDESKVTLVEVMDAMGKLVYSSKQYHASINLSNHAAGVYLVRVHLNSKITTTKIVMEK